MPKTATLLTAPEHNPYWLTIRQTVKGLMYWAKEDIDATFGLTHAEENPLLVKAHLEAMRREYSPPYAGPMEDLTKAVTDIGKALSEIADAVAAPEAED